MRGTMTLCLIWNAVMQYNDVSIITWSSIINILFACFVQLFTHISDLKRLYLLS